MGWAFSATTLLGLAGAGFMFALAGAAARRTRTLSAGAFVAWSATAGVRLLVDVMQPLLPQPWAAGAAVFSHLTTWFVLILFLRFGLRFASEPFGVERWGARPFWAAGAVVCVVILTNPIHALYRTAPWTTDTIAFGPVGWGMVAIGNVVVLAVILLLAVTMIRAEGRRVPLALVIAGALLNWFAKALLLLGRAPLGVEQVDVVIRAASAGLFAVALFGFGLLRLVPIGRDAVLHRMDEGWLVLDPAGRIADLNPAAERMFRVSAREAIGRDAVDTLQGVSGLDAIGRGRTDKAFAVDARPTMGGSERHLDVHVTPIQGRRGVLLGRTLLVRDITAQRRAEAIALERERALAALQERETVARELHDGLAQVLGFVRLQAEAARGLLRRDAATAEAYLSRLAETALEAHGEVRSFIAGSAAASQTGFMAAIAASLRRVGEEAGLEAELRVDEGLDDDALAPPVAAHLLRIVQEALHNVRKHARASRVTLIVEADDAWVQVVVADDGAGFPEFALHEAGSGFGLRFMHERATAAGGTLTIAPGLAEGTRVTVRVPRREAPSVPQGSSAEAVAAGSGG
jgi:PAS domain S-box-containing protein